MKSRCSPCDRMLLFGVLGIFIFCSQTLHAQCESDFSYQSSFLESTVNPGKIELSLRGKQAGMYTVNLYRKDDKIVPVETRQVSSTQEIVFKNLKPSSYYIKIEWGNGCRKILGGLEGIIITQNVKKDE